MPPAPITLPGHHAAQPAANEDEEDSDGPLEAQGVRDDAAFHGYMPLDDLHQQLRTNGDYLLRSELKGEGESEETRYYVSVFHKGTIYSFEVHVQPGQVSIDGNTFRPSIIELIQFHRKHNIPISKNGVTLVKPVRRQPWELRSRDVEMNEVLGEGAFGVVRKGFLIDRFQVKHEVAIKVPKNTISRTVTADALKEARIQRDYKHPHVLRLLGVCAEHSTLLIVLEFVDGGPLDKYLQRFKDQLTNELTCMFCYDVSCGIEYLHSRCCVHRDVAARNCLIDTRTKLLKISDFGLSSVGNVVKMEHNRPAPIRWLSPDVLKTALYTQSSDIWSLGIVYWEIMTFCGSVPYKNFTLAEVQLRLNGTVEFHPIMPLMCPPKVKALAHACWSFEASQRPTAQSCVAQLREFAHVERYDALPSGASKQAGDSGTKTAVAAVKPQQKPPPPPTTPLPAQTPQASQTPLQPPEAASEHRRPSLNATPVESKPNANNKQQQQQPAEGVRPRNKSPRDEKQQDVKTAHQKQKSGGSKKKRSQKKGKSKAKKPNPYAHGGVHTNVVGSAEPLYSPHRSHPKNGLHRRY